MTGQDPVYEAVSPLETPKPPTKIWGIGPAIGLSVAILAIYLSLQVLVVFIYAVAGIISNPAVDPLSLGVSLTTDGSLFAIAEIISAGAGVGLIVLFIKARRGPSIREYLSLKTITPRLLFALSGITIGLVFLNSLVAYLTGAGAESNYISDLFLTSGWPVVFGLAVVVFAPVFEEMFFRGFLFVSLEKSRIGPAGAVVLTTLTWTLLHLGNGLFNLASIFVLGILLGVTKLKTRSLYSTIFMHSLWNLIAVLTIMLTSR